MAQSELDTRFFVETGLAARIAEAIEPAVVDLGYRLVRVRMIGTDGQTLQVMAERPDGSMSVDDCETISRQISPLLDTYDFIPGSYRLEVSSPGIDRPLVRPSDFETWSGHTVKVELKEMIDGRKRYRGELEGYQNGEMRIEVDLPGHGRQLIGIPVELLAEAKLVLTDELVRESLRRASKSGEIGDGAEAPENIDLIDDMTELDSEDEHRSGRADPEEKH